jgi:ankyrin repeat protein
MNFPGFTSESFLANIQAWISNGGSAEVTDSQLQWSLLHYAAEFQNIEAVEFLIRCGCNPNAQNRYGQTPLHIAVDSETDAAIQDGVLPDYQIARRLMECGASPEIRDRQGLTPQEWAANFGAEAAQIFGALVQANRLLHRNQ